MTTLLYPIGSVCECGAVRKSMKQLWVRGMCKSCYQYAMGDNIEPREFCPTTEYRDLLTPEVRQRLEEREKRNLNPR